MTQQNLLNMLFTHGIIKREVTYPLLYVQTFMTVFAQFASSTDSSAMILYNPCLYMPCMILVNVVHHLSFHFYWLHDLIYSNCKRKTLVYSRRYATCLVKNNVLFCSKFYGYPHHQNRLCDMLKPPNESCETSVFLELVPSQGRKSKNSNVNNFLSRCFKF